MPSQQISIAMCTYNGGRYLEEQLESFARQERLPDELIICDDGSKDNTIEIIQNFAARITFPVRLTVNQGQLRTVKNFEKAIGLCKGDIICLSDQDDVWYPEKLKCIEEFFSGSGRIGAVISDADIVDENLNRLGYRLFQSNKLSPNNFNLRKQRRFMNGGAFEVVLNHKVVTGATLGFRSKFRESFMPIPSEWMHDHWIALNIAAFADLAIIKKPLIMYRQHSSNQIGRKKQHLREYLAKARNNGTRVYLEELIKYQLAYNHFVTLGNAQSKEKVLIELSEKLKHLQACSSMSPDILHRFVVVLREIVNLNYYRYSGGWQNIVTDIVFYI